MTDRPIIFSAPMVRALLDGRKTQTRLVLPKSHPKFPQHNQIRMDVLTFYPHQPEVWYWDGAHDRVGASYKLRFAIGDRLWVRENFMPAPMETPPKEPRDTRWSIAYGAGGQAETTAPTGYNPMLYNYERWRPSIHMPRWASRLTLIVTDVRVQQLQEISEEDALAEGISMIIEDSPSDAWFSGLRTDCKLIDADMYGWHHNDAAAAYEDLWNSIHGHEAWEANPWVSAISFRTIHANIDSTEATA